MYRLNDDWIQATGSIVDGGFLVHEKADFSGAEARAIARKYHDLRRKLLNEGCVKNNVFVKNHVFKSKYEAAIVLLGRHVSEEAERVLWFATGSYKV